MCVFEGGRRSSQVREEEQQIFKQEWMREWIQIKKGHSEPVELVFSSSLFCSLAPSSFLTLLRTSTLTLSLSVMTKWEPGTRASSSYLDLWTQRGKTDRRALDLTKEQGRNKWTNQGMRAGTYNTVYFTRTSGLAISVFYCPFAQSFFIQERNCSQAARPPHPHFTCFPISSYLLFLFLQSFTSSFFHSLSILTLWISGLCRQ